MTADKADTEYTYQEVWDKLSTISVADHIQKKGNLSYLSWAWAWQVMMENYPSMKFFFHEETTYKDGSMQVNCTVSIGNLDRDMWLPVMDYKNKAIASPSARDINDARMRCLVKCFALFGLGHYIYAGEDIPTGNERTRVANQKTDSNDSENGEDGDLSGIPDAFDDMHRASEDAFMVFLEDAKDIDSLRQFFSDNKPALSKMEKQAKERFDRVMAAFKAKADEIKSKSA